MTLVYDLVVYDINLYVSDVNIVRYCNNDFIDSYIKSWCQCNGIEDLKRHIKHHNKTCVKGAIYGDIMTRKSHIYTSTLQ